ncbi:MAG: DUF3996 domain-containing protein [Treponema sp.]|nr:DUF3996 domain-containing protein [Treponema sp.]
MKRFLLVLVILVVVAGTVFAQASHPKGLGIGVLWRSNMVWGGSGFNGNAALSLKLPSMPIFWAINFDGGNNYLYIGVSGDNYLMGGHLTSNILFWYLGLGGYVGLSTWNNQKNNSGDASISLGARLPVGLSLQLLERILEVFVEIAPSLGVSFWTSGQGGVHFPDGSLGIAIGLRVWIK